MKTSYKETPKPNKKCCIVAGMALTLSAGITTAGAEPFGHFERSVYATMGLGTSRLTPSVDNFPALDVNDRVEPAGQLTVGVDVTELLSVEVHSADLGSAGFSPRGNADGSSSAGRFNYHMNGISALAYFGNDRSNAKRRGLTGYGRVGYVDINNSATNNTLNYQRDSGSGLLLGAGIEYAMRSGLGMRAELMAADEDVKFGQIAVSYRLGMPGSNPVMAAAKAPEPKPVVTPAPVVETPTVQAPPAKVRYPEISEVVNFANNSADLTGSAKIILDEFAQRLASFPEASLQLKAHTDSNGSYAYNQALSQRRASSVKRYLTERGISSSAISITAAGETKPIQSNSTNEGRFSNRRVELTAGNLFRQPAVAQ
jgi:outer membrane protein OmpA-like peptidoglycan-associated protein